MNEHDVDLLAVLHEFHAGQRAIRDEIRGLHATLTAAIVGAHPQGGESSLSRADRASLAVLLPAIVASTGAGIVFTARDLSARAAIHPVLRASLAKVFIEIDTRTPRRIGKLLSRSVGYVQDGLHVERGDGVRDGVLWRVDQL